MPRVLTNNITMAYGKQSAIDVDPTTWFLLEPNGINAFGATITTVARSPISKNRQRRKGTVTDLDSAVEFEADLTLSSYIDFIEGWAFASATNNDLVFRPTAVTATGYTVPALDATQGGKLQFTGGGPISLMYARGFAVAANNGLKPLSADAADTDTEIQIAGLTIEATPPDTAELEIAGIRAETGDLAIIVTGVTALLTSGNNAAVNNIDFTTLGLTVGQFIHVGGLLAANQFSAAVGFARITSIAAAALGLDKLRGTFATDDGAAETVDLLFNRFVRNVDVDHANYIEQYFTFEATFPTLGTGNAPRYQYALNNLCDQVSFELPLTNKATVTFGLIGTDTDNPTDTQKPGASDASRPNRTGAFNTSADIAHLSIRDVDDAGISTDFKSLTLTLNNNVSPEKVLGILGARFMNTGNFEVDIETQLIFSNEDVIAAIRDNTTVSIDFLITNDDGAIAVDMPNVTMGGGDREYPVNESVLINTTEMAFGDPADTFTYSFGTSLFPIVP